MDWLTQFLVWFKKPEIYGAIGTIAAVAGVVWGIYTYFSGSEPPPSEITKMTASEGGIAVDGDISPQVEPGGTAIITTGDVTIERDPLAAKALEALKKQLKRAELREQEYQDQVKALTESVTALAQQRGKPQAPPGIDEALEQLAQGNTAAAEDIFQKIEQRKIAEGKAANKEAAEAARHLGALAFLHDTKKALDAYRRSTELDPKNLKGWNRLGQLLARTDALTEAEEAFQKVVALGQLANDQKWIAIGYGNLGDVYQIRGELEKAEDMFQKSLAINEALGRKEGMANNYTNLGDVYQIRGELKKAEAMYQKSLVITKELGHKEGMASNYTGLGIVYGKRKKLVESEEMFQKSLAISEALGHKEGMASNYTNLGNVYRIRGELEKAEETYKKALALFQEIGATPQVKKVQGLLANLKNK